MNKIIPVLFFLIIPVFVSAVGFVDILNDVRRIIGMLIPIFFAIALLVFLWGMVKFIYHAGDEKKVQEGKGIMYWGIIALFVMSAVWGLVHFLQIQLGLPGSDRAVVPREAPDSAVTPPEASPVFFDYFGLETPQNEVKVPLRPIEPTIPPEAPPSNPLQLYP